MYIACPFYVTLASTWPESRTWQAHSASRRANRDTESIESRHHTKCAWQTNRTWTRLYFVCNETIQLALSKPNDEHRNSSYELSWVQPIISCHTKWCYDVESEPRRRKLRGNGFFPCFRCQAWKSSFLVSPRTTSFRRAWFRWRGRAAGGTSAPPAGATARPGWCADSSASPTPRNPRSTGPNPQLRKSPIGWITSRVLGQSRHSCHVTIRAGARTSVRMITWSGSRAWEPIRTRLVGSTVSQAQKFKKYILPTFLKGNV